MIRKKHLNILSVLMVGFLLGWASKSIMPKKKHHDRSPIERFKKLGLEQEKFNKVKTIVEAAEKEKKILKSILDVKKTIFDEHLETTKDENILRASYKDFTSQRSKIEQKRFEVMLEVHKNLSLEQIKKLRSFGPHRSKNRKGSGR